MVWRFRPKPHSHASDAEGGAISAPAASITSLTVAALVAVGSVLSLAGGLAVTGALSAANVTTSSMTVSGAIAAGSVGIGTAPVAGYPALVAAGTGGAGGPLPVVLYTWVGSSSTANTVGEMRAAQFVIPAGTMVRGGDAVELYALSRATTTTLSKRLEFRIGGDTTSFGYSTSGSRQWLACGRMVRDSPTNGTQYFERQRSDPGGSAGQSVDWDIGNTITWASTDVLVEVLLYGVTGATAAGDEDMTLKYFQVVYWPAL